MFTNNSDHKSTKLKLFIATLVSLLTLPALLAAQTNWFVAPAPAGKDDGSFDGRSWNQPFATISKALTEAPQDAGHVIHVSNGVYLLTETIDVNKGVTVLGVNSAGQTNTVIDGGKAVRCFTINHVNAVIDGLLITNGSSLTADLNGYGGGVHLSNGTLRNSLITGNSGIRGGGICAENSSIVSNCAIVGNLGDSEASGEDGGGGIIMFQSAQLWNSSVLENTILQGYGSGVYVRNADASLIANCTIANNQGGSAALTHRSGPDLTVSNCVITNNEGSRAAIHVMSKVFYMIGTTLAGNKGINAGGIYIPSSGTAVLDDCLIENNESAQGGGGVNVLGMCLITNCTVRANRAQSYGGGIQYYITSGALGSGTVTHSRVTGNIIDGGGAGALYGAGLCQRDNVDGLLIENCEFTGNMLKNSSQAYGGGVYISSNVVMRNCLVANNSANGTHASLGGIGGGIRIVAGGNNLIENCTVVDNFARLNGGGIHLTANGNDQVINSIVYGNYIDGAEDNWFFGDDSRKAAITYTCSPEADENWGEGCETAAPLFMAPMAYDYRLQPISPCVNAGLIRPWMYEKFDLDGLPRLDKFSQKIDLGCYEYMPQGTLILIH